MVHFSAVIKAFSGFMWGYPLLILLIGGGLFFLIYSEFIPLRHFRHAISVIVGLVNYTLITHNVSYKTRKFNFCAAKYLKRDSYFSENHSNCKKLIFPLILKNSINMK